MVNRNKPWEDVIIAIVLFLSLIITPNIYAQLPAFPGAEGFGKYTVGGRGGKVILVTNLNDSGPGSLRAAVETKGKRIVVFRVGGLIRLTQHLKIADPNITIAGQTAPGDGICITGRSIRIMTSEVIIRNIRLRLGKGAGSGIDGISINGVGAGLNNIILDHISASWATDENFGLNARDAVVKNVTIQNSITAEGLMPHSKGMLIQGKAGQSAYPRNITIYNNFFANSVERLPAIGYNNEVETINNVIYHWTFKATRVADGRANVIGNYYKPGPQVINELNAVQIEKIDGTPRVYVRGNIGPARPTDNLPQNYIVNISKGREHVVSAPVINGSGIKDISAFEARDYVLENAGAMPRDAVDARSIQHFLNGNGKFISDESQVGGMPRYNGGTAPRDSDNDGMPDDWELSQGLNPNNGSDHNGDINGNGYTNIEDYINLFFSNEVTTTPNTPPTISNISDISILKNTSSNAIAFQIADAETAASGLGVVASSNNSNLIANSGLTLGGDKRDRTLVVTPEPDAVGDVTITITVSDGALETKESFVVSIVEPTANEAPSISDIPDQNLEMNTPSDPINFEIWDSETASSGLDLTVTSQDESLVAGSGLTLSGSTRNRTLIITPEPDAVGEVTITLTVSDGESQTSEDVLVTITDSGDPGNTGNTAPSISDIADQNLEMNTPSDPIDFEIWDNETASSGLDLTVTSQDETLVAGSGLTLSGSTRNRTLIITPEPDAVGEVTITLTVSDGESQTSQDVVVTITDSGDPGNTGNTAPSISDIPAQNLEMNTPSNAISFQIWDDETASSGLDLSVASQDESLIANSGLALSGSTRDRSLVITPQTNAVGNVTVTITVSDGELETTKDVEVTITSTNNRPPTISNIPNQQINQDISLGPVNFQISDPDDPVDQLTVTATSDDQSLVPDNVIEITGSGTDRSLFITPDNSVSGSTTIRITVSDGVNETEESFLLTIAIAGENSIPTISEIVDQVINQDESMGPLAFQVDDLDHDPNDLVITANSSNQTLVPNENISISGSGKTREIQLTPASGQFGETTITITVSDGIDQVSETFKLIVNEITEAPGITNIADQSIDQGTSTGALAFTISDPDTPVGQLNVSAKSSNNVLVPASAIVLAGQNAQRTITITPDPSRFGEANITITVSDGTHQVTEMFTLVVIEQVENMAPTISNINDQVTEENQEIGPVRFTVGDSDNLASELRITAKSNNQNLIPDQNMTINGSGTNRDIIITPASNQSGSAVVTVIVSDGVDQASTSFKVEVNALPKAPTISNISGKSTDQDVTIGPIAFTINDEDTPVGDLTVTAASSNPNLVTNDNIILGGSGSNRTVTVTPEPGKHGSASITITVSDGTNQAQTSFKLTVVSSDPDDLSSQISAIDVSCNGNSDGSAEISVDGGVAPYTFEWSTGATTNAIGNLTAGSYSVTVTDAIGNTVDDQVTISEPRPLEVAATIIDETCRGEDGIIQVKVTGGSGSYTYRWSNGSTTASLNNLQADEYSLVVTDSEGCVAQSSFDVGISITDINVEGQTTQPTCTNNGSIALNVSGANQPYSYQWSNGARSKNVSNLEAGTYTVTVTDQNGCKFRQNFILENTVAPITASGEVTDATCSNDDGAISLSVNGGTAPYTFLWSNGSTAQNPDNLSSGSHTVIIQDQTGCSAEFTFEVHTAPGATDFSVEAVVTNANCSGSGGSIVIEEPLNYTYDWSNGATGPELDDLEPGNYTVTVTNIEGCYTTETFTVNADPGPAKPEIEVNGNTLSVNTGEMFQWYLEGSPISGATSNTYVIETSGTYSVSISGEYGCTTASDDLYVEKTDDDTLVEDNNIINTGEYLKQVDIYPNPVQDQVNVDVLLGQPAETTLGIYDISGFEVEQRDMGTIEAQFESVIDMSTLPSGLYIIQVKSGNEVVMRKVLKQ